MLHLCYEPLWAPRPHHSHYDFRQGRMVWSTCSHLPQKVFWAPPSTFLFLTLVFSSAAGIALTSPSPTPRPSKMVDCEIEAKILKSTCTLTLAVNSETGQVDLQASTHSCKNNKFQVTDHLVHSSTCKDMVFFLDMTFKKKKTALTKAIALVCAGSSCSSPTSTPPPTPTPGACLCGLAKRSSRIVGGQETEVNEYPWQVRDVSVSMLSLESPGGDS